MMASKKATKTARRKPVAPQVTLDEMFSVLESAYDHLEYCNYGDKWERECAKAEGLRGKIEDMIEQYKAMKESELKTVKTTKTARRKPVTVEPTPETVTEPPPIATEPPPLPYDVTQQNGTIVITSPREQQSKRMLRAYTQSENSTFMPGSRMLAIVDEFDAYYLGGNQHEKSFAFIDEFGIHVWNRYRGDGIKKTIYEKYADMIERQSYYESKGFAYTFSGVSEV